MCVTHVCPPSCDIDVDFTWKPALPGLAQTAVRLLSEAADSDTERVGKPQDIASVVQVDPLSAVYHRPADAGEPPGDDPGVETTYADEALTLSNQDWPCGDTNGSTPEPTAPGGSVGDGFQL